MKYVLILGLLFSRFCYAEKLYSISYKVLLSVCTMGYETAIKDNKKHIPLKERKDLFDREGIQDACIVLVNKHLNVHDD